jgi:hypothetical protein
LVVNWVSSCPSFFSWAPPLLLACIYFQCSYLYNTTVTSLKYCALNAEFQHFILRFSKTPLLCRCHFWKRG